MPISPSTAPKRDTSAHICLHLIPLDAPYLLPQPPDRLPSCASIFKYVVRAHCGHYGAPSAPRAVHARLVGSHGFTASNNEPCGRRWLRRISGPLQASDAPAALQKPNRKQEIALFLFIQPRGTRQVWEIFFEHVQLVQGSGNVRAAFDLIGGRLLFLPGRVVLSGFMSPEHHVVPARCFEL